jgi:hypothetical protein
MEVLPVRVDLLVETGTDPRRLTLRDPQRATSTCSNRTVNARGIATYPVVDTERPIGLLAAGGVA